MFPNKNKSKKKTWLMLIRFHMKTYSRRFKSPYKEILSFPPTKEPRTVWEESRAAFHSSIGETSPIVAAVVNPLPHHGVVSVQVDGDVLVLRIQHVAELLQSAVLRVATGGVPQVVHDVRHVHFTCSATATGARVKRGFGCAFSCSSSPRGAVLAQLELHLLRLVAVLV